MRISKRREVNLREVWSVETMFSDWLASDAGLELIESDIGISVEAPRRECREGDFRCDIVGHALGDESHVIVIENQFNKTDHDHLGKMLTYAAVHSATTGIWISERISEDHRQVVDWLNAVTPTNVNFYLAQIKAYCIDDSPVAPELDVVCRPNLSVKLRESTQTEVQNRNFWRKQFWEDVLSYIKEQKPPFNVQSPGVDYWSGITIGRSGFYIALSLESKNSRICCQLCIDSPWRLSAFEQLFLHREAIEHEIGSKLEWLDLPEKKASRIKLYADIDPSDTANREQVKVWMYRQADAFYRAFSLRVKQLVAVSTENL